MNKETIVQVSNLKKKFTVAGGKNFQKKSFYAVNDVSFEIKKGEVFGLVGESGCGKSTLSSIILKLLPASEGQVFFQGQDITGLNNRQMKAIRKDMQVVFQDPFDSLDPRFTLHAIMEEPLLVQNVGTKEEREEIIRRIFKEVGLPESFLTRYPHQLSGGQRQRLCIARALTLSPSFMVLDEAVAALDVSIQAQILNLLLDLKEEHQLTYLFISHNLAVVKFMADRIGVMYFGKIVELADKEELFEHVLHPYTQALLSAVPVPDPDAIRQREILQAGVPSLIDPPSGCAFHPRCKYAMDICKKQAPELTEYEKGHFVACHRCREGGVS